MELLERVGPQIGEPLVKNLGDGILELRVKAGNAYRILFFTWTGRRLVLLHGFLKKTQKTPPGEIERAKRYRADFLERRNSP